MNTDMNQPVRDIQEMYGHAYQLLRNDSLSAESLVLGKLAHHLCIQRTFLVYIYIYIYIWYVRPHFSSTVLGLRNVGGVKCQPLLKHGNHCKRH